MEKIQVKRVYKHKNGLDYVKVTKADEETVSFIFITNNTDGELPISEFNETYSLAQLIGYELPRATVNRLLNRE